MKTKIFLLVLLSFLLLNCIYAQKKRDKITLTGNVLDLENKPICNAIIIIDDKKTGCVTDSAGNFSVNVSTAAAKIGVFTFGNGYFEDSINGRDNIDINFATVAKTRHVNTDNESGSEEATLSGRHLDPELGVNIGYAHVKVKDLIGDVGVVDARNEKFSTKYTSVIEMIVRNVSGFVWIGNMIYLINSRNLEGYVAPLVILDGSYITEEDLDFVSPSSVESIVVIKDGTGAIYGSRAYGGVIIVTTRVNVE